MSKIIWFLILLALAGGAMVFSYDAGRVQQAIEDSVGFDKAAAECKTDYAALETRTALRVQLSDDRDRDSFKLAGTAMDVLDELYRLRRQRALLEPFIRSGRLAIVEPQK